MDKLADILSAAGVDVSTLDVILQADMETIHRLTVPGAQAIETWEKVRGLVPQTGCWPVLLGDDSTLEALKDNLQRLRYPRAVRILEEAATIEPLQWFENRLLDEIDQLQGRLEYAQKPAEEAYCEKLLAQEGPFRGMRQGPWPEGFRPNHTFRIPCEPPAGETTALRDEAGRVVAHFLMPGGGPLPLVNIGLVSTPSCWQAPAYLRYGAWNNCPSAAEHVTLFKYWGELYGAEVVGMAGHVVEMKVARPPTDRDGALELAAQQYLYCEDIVGTLQRHAARLLGGTVWFFWWD
jgi:Domain of unknown function (DUF4253)